MKQPLLLSRLEAVVYSHPDVIALECDGVRLTYKQLWSASGELADLFRVHSSSTDHFGLEVKRNITTYVLYLAILRADGVVVPFSADVAQKRREITIAQARIEFMTRAVTTPVRDCESARLSRAVSRADLRRSVLLTTDMSAQVTLERVGTISVGSNADADDERLAYILFTSGSTGYPKGVPIQDKALDAFISHSITLYDLRPGCRVTQLFDLTFDVSVYDMFGAWNSGATLVVGSRADMLMPVGWARRERITHFCSVPSTIVAAQAASQLNNPLPDLRLAAFIGEPLRLDLARSWKKTNPSAQIANFYGPTELTIAISTYFLPDRLSDWPVTINGTVPIGRPYAHLDWMLRPLNATDSSTEGELLVRGPQRFNGYLNSAENKGRFWPDSDTLPTNASWYRTGDVVTILDDGNLLHLGRIDDQVKVRGYRVELAEVETALYHCSGVTKAAVVNFSAGRVQALAAFVVAGSTDPSTVRAELKNYLPPYMVPKVVELLTDLPYLTSGKVDRTELRTRAAALIEGPHQ